MENRTIIKSVLLVVGGVAVLFLAGLAVARSPSADMTEAAKLPATTITTEPPPEGAFATVGFQRIPDTIDTRPEQ